MFKSVLLALIADFGDLWSESPSSVIIRRSYGEANHYLKYRTALQEFVSLFVSHLLSLLRVKLAVVLFFLLDFWNYRIPLLVLGQSSNDGQFWPP
jgi:hypothetical protein